MITFAHATRQGINFRLRIAIYTAYCASS